MKLVSFPSSPSFSSSSSSWTEAYVPSSSFFFPSSSKLSCLTTYEKIQMSLSSLILHVPPCSLPLSLSPSSLTLLSINLILTSLLAQTESAVIIEPSSLITLRSFICLCFFHLHLVFLSRRLSKFSLLPLFRPSLSSRQGIPERNDTVCRRRWISSRTIQTFSSILSFLTRVKVCLTI